MNISPISFCKKIPINHSQVIDKRLSKPVDVTFFEYDCEELDDIYDVGDLDDTWVFRDIITSGMHRQFLKNTIHQKDNSLHYYCVKDDFDRTLGLCQTVEGDTSIDVKLIVSNPNKRYKYVGQTILAMLGQKAQQGSFKDLRIRAALSDTYKYYEDICGFEQDLSEGKSFTRDYRMRNENIPNFIQNLNDKKRLH